MKRAALVGWLCLAAAQAYAQSPKPVPAPLEKTSPPQHSEKAAEQKQQSTQPPTAVNILPPPKTNSEAEQERRDRAEKAETDKKLVELTASLADFTKWLAIATGALVVATAGLVWFAGKQSKDTRQIITAAKDSAASAKAAFDLERAWIGAPTIQPIKQNNGSFHFDLVVENIGKSPATGLYIGDSLVEHSVAKTMQKWLENGRTVVAQSSSVFNNFSVVPRGKFGLQTDATNRHFNIHLDIDDWRRSKGAGYPYGDKPRIAGCILYGPLIEGEPRRTLFSAECEINDGELSVRHIRTGETT